MCGSSSTTCCSNCDNSVPFAGPTCRTLGGGTDQNPTGGGQKSGKRAAKRKFDALLNRSTGGSHPQRPNDRLVDNLSSRPLSIAEKGVLARGLYFASAPKRLLQQWRVASAECAHQEHSSRGQGLLGKSQLLPTNLSPEEQRPSEHSEKQKPLSLPPRTREMPQSSWTRLHMMGRSGHCLRTPTHTGG